MAKNETISNPHKILDLNNGFLFTFNDEREWIWKAVPFSPIAHRHQELPTYDVINVIEQRYKKHFDKCLAATAKDIARYLLK